MMTDMEQENRIRELEGELEDARRQLRIKEAAAAGAMRGARDAEKMAVALTRTIDRLQDAIVAQAVLMAESGPINTTEEAGE